MQQTTKCDKGCCYIYSCEYPKDDKRIFVKRKKSGVLLHDKLTNKILLVQSRGLYWGLPKGSCEEGEDFIDCAIREVKEETGILLEKSQLTNPTKIMDNAVYYYSEIPETTVKVQKKTLGKDSNGLNETNWETGVISGLKNLIDLKPVINDANAITWINVDCLKKMIRDEKMILNRHSRQMIKIFCK